MIRPYQTTPPTHHHLQFTGACPTCGGHATWTADAWDERVTYGIDCSTCGHDTRNSKS